MKLEQAATCGYYARLIGHRGIETCPTFCPGDIGLPERQAWREGWHKADREERVKYPRAEKNKAKRRGK